MFGDDTLFEKCMSDFEAIEIDSNKNESKLNEGQFSWHYSDTDEPIYSTEGHQKTVWLIDDKGNKWQEDAYEGYGVFGGKDFYILLGEMNGLELSGAQTDDEEGFYDDRDKAISLVFKDSDTGEDTRGVIYPKLVANPDRAWSSVRNPRSHAGQGWYEGGGSGFDDDDDEDDYDESKKVADKGEPMTASTDSHFENLVDKFSQIEEDENKNVDESTLEVAEKDFDAVEEIKGSGAEGIVCLGAGGDPQDWIDGVIDLWHEEGIFEGTADEAFSEVFKLTSTGGRTDLVMVFNESAPLDIGKVAMWRLRFGECSWISDFVDNYASHYGKEDLEREEVDLDDENLGDEEFEAKTNEKEVKEEESKVEEDAENTEFTRKASAARHAEDVHPELSQASKERFVADTEKGEIVGGRGREEVDLEQKATEEAIAVLVDRVQEWVGEEVDAESIRKVVWAFSKSPDLTDLIPVSKPEGVAEGSQDEKKAAPVCSKCNTKHWPFKKCVAAEDSIDVDKEAVTEPEHEKENEEKVVEDLYDEPEHEPTTVGKDDVPDEVSVQVDKYEVARMYEMYKGIHKGKLSIEEFTKLCVENLLDRYCSSEYIKEDDIEKFVDFPYEQESSEEPGLKRPNRFSVDTEESKKEVEEQLSPRSDDLLYISRSLMASEDEWDLLKTHEGSNQAAQVFTFVSEEAAMAAGSKIADIIGGEFRGKEDPRVDPSRERSPRGTLEAEEIEEDAKNDWAVFITKPLKKRVSTWLPELKAKEFAKLLTGVETSKAMSREDAKKAGFYGHHTSGE